MAGAEGLRALALRPLGLGSIRPRGWLRRQLRIQANGLSGHLDEFWPDVAESGWIGGAAEGWERGPYWLDGIVPLAYLLDDEGLKTKVQRWVDHILTHQHADGWLGPVQPASHVAGSSYATYDPWPCFVALKALTQYADATVGAYGNTPVHGGNTPVHGGTMPVHGGDLRVAPAIERYLRRLDAVLDETPLASWAHFRAADLVLSIHWLYDHAPDGSRAAPWLLALAAKVRAQTYNWQEHFANFLWLERQREGFSLATHVVNNAMAVKTPGVWYRQSGDAVASPENDLQAVWHALNMLDTYHGQATGLFSGDEHYAGRNPSQGTELCAVNEYLYSLEVLLSILAAPSLADRLERIAFNALPATFSPDMWAHQYDQQANQVVCRVSQDRVYTNNGSDANIFGLEPNYGCCTANLSQGWPKFAAHLWMGTPDGGLAAVAYAPSEVALTLGGAQVEVACETEYPFGDLLHLVVQTSAPARFPLLLRIPGWATQTTVQVAAEPVRPAKPGEFYRIEREWRGSTEITLRLPMPVRATRRYHNALAIERGPLVYALKIGERWKQVGGQAPHADWEVYPTTPWNYALQFDERHPEESVTFERHPVGDYPFSPEGAPVVARAWGRRLPTWHLEHAAAGPLPVSPVCSAEPLEELTLLPYGCTNLRVTEFPTLERADGEHARDA